MSCVEVELVLDDGGRVRSISITILHLLSYYESMLVDIGDECGRVEGVDVDN